MKKSLRLSLITLLLAASTALVWSRLGTLPDTTGLVGHWPLGVDDRQGEAELNTNWDMEAGATSGWSFDAKTNGARADETTDVYRGSTAVRLTNSTSASIAIWQDGMSTADGELYLLSVWVKDVDSPTTPLFQVTNSTLIDAGNTTSGSFTGLSTTEWKRYWAIYEATSTTIDPYIRATSAGSQGDFLIDDFSVQKLEAADISGSGNHGDIFNGVVPTTGKDGASDSAFDFNNTGSGHINVGDPADGSLDQYRQSPQRLARYHYQRFSRSRRVRDGDQQ